MKTTTCLGLAGLLVIAASLTACDMKVDFTNSSPKGITAATLAKGYDAVKHDGIDPTTTFSTSDKVVYVVYFFLTAEKGLPAGNYRCNLYLNPKKDEKNKPDKSLDFTAK